LINEGVRVARATDAAPRRGVRQPRETREPSRREELLEVALKLFNEKGYEATSMQDIADEMNLLKGSIYHYVQSKDDLLFWVIGRTHERFLENMAAVQEIKEGPTVKLQALIEGHVRIATQHVVEARVYMNDFKSLDPSRKKAILDQRHHYEGFARQLIEAAQEAGLASPDVAPRLAGLAIMSMLTGIPRWYHVGGSIAPEDLGAAFSQYALRILGCA
jgi:TetR/AcrR family transcriptional regulator, cholesterol catabolism regulator